MVLENTAPELGTTGWQMLVWGFFISTIACYHGTYTINSLSHVFGKQRYRTGDESRNNWFLALITLGEGWHNNHHHYPSSARQGFYWWEVDITYYMLKVMSWLGIIWDLRAVPDLRPRSLARAASGETHENRDRRLRHLRHDGGVSAATPSTTSRCSRRATTSAATPTRGRGPRRPHLRGGHGLHRLQRPHLSELHPR